MLNLKELLNPNSFLFLENPTSKKMVFDNICNEAFLKFNIDKNSLLNNLIKREKIGTTTIGNGIAIPHVQNGNIKKPSCIVTILSKGLDFVALDNNPVDVIVLFILPEWSKSENLQILIRYQDSLEFWNTDKLRGCKSEESAFAIISHYLSYKPLKLSYF